MIALGVVVVMTDVGAADVVDPFPTCDVVAEPGVRGPEAGCNIRDESQKPEIPALQDEHAGWQGRSHTPLEEWIAEACTDHT